MRGAPDGRLAGNSGAGIIPAYAGSTQGRACSPSRPADHPRVCGEHICWLADFFSGPGSSPRMRGAPRLLDISQSKLRIIPAYAGSTVGSCLSVTVSTDHPRGCGEHKDGRPERERPLGSSPRMRGAPNSTSPTVLPSRIIPAYAGSTKGDAPLDFFVEDHPRVCGEHVAFLH